MELKTQFENLKRDLIQHRLESQRQIQELERESIQSRNRISRLERLIKGLTLTIHSLTYCNVTFMKLFKACKNCSHKLRTMNHHPDCPGDDRPLPPVPERGPNVDDRQDQSFQSDDVPDNTLTLSSEAEFPDVDPDVDTNNPVSPRERPDEEVASTAQKRYRVQCSNCQKHFWNRGIRNHKQRCDARRERCTIRASSNCSSITYNSHRQLKVLN